MNQQSELRTYRLLIKEHTNTTHFNFTDAADILLDYEANLFSLNTISSVVLVTLYIPIFAIGLLGNIMIIATVSVDKARKANLFFLVNLALADLAVTVFCIPTSVGAIIYKLWVYGTFLCKFTAFVQGVAVAVSVFSMTAMSVGRYLALQHPAVHRHITRRQSFILIVLMWLVASIFFGPLLYIRTVDILTDLPFVIPLPFCIENWPEDQDRQAYGVFLLFVVFIIPAFTIGMCYGNIGKALFVTESHNQMMNSDTSAQRVVSIKRAARMVIILICVFMICWLPYNCMSALTDISDNVHLANALPFVLWLGHSHSAINPILYWSLNRHFRDSVHKMVKVVKIHSCTTAIQLPQDV